MRSRSLFFLVGLCTVLASFLMMAGCSSDDKVIADPIDVVDTISHAHFDAVSDQAETFVQATEEILNDALSFAAVTNDGLEDLLMTGMGDLDDQSNETWKIYVLIGSDASITEVDSIQFSKNGTPQTNGIGADRINYKHHWYYVNNDSTTIHADIVANGVDGNSVVINGTHEFRSVTFATVGSDQVTTIYDIQADYTDWTVTKTSGNWTSACPNSGTATITVDVSVQVGSAAAVTSSWDFDLTITDGAADGTLTLGTDEVDYTCEVCPAN